jgi:hypothetical protein
LSNIRKPRTNYNILGFEFSCLHSCSEYKWGICSHCRSRNKCKNHVRPVYSSEEGIFYPIEKIEISSIHAFDLGTYIHEITEASIIQILRRYHINWHKAVQFDGYNETYIVHFISAWGANNGACFEPVTRKHKPLWK